MRVICGLFPYWTINNSTVMILFWPANLFIISGHRRVSRMSSLKGIHLAAVNIRRWKDVSCQMALSIIFALTFMQYITHFCRANHFNLSDTMEERRLYSEHQTVNNHFTSIIVLDNKNVRHYRIAVRPKNFQMIWYFIGLYNDFVHDLTFIIRFSRPGVDLILQAWPWFVPYVASIVDLLLNLTVFNRTNLNL